MRRIDLERLAPLLLSASLVACAAHAPPVTPVAPVPPLPASSVPAQILSQRAEGTARELFSRGETAVLAQRWQEAVDSFEALLAAEPDGPSAPASLLYLGQAYEGLEQRAKARDRYHELARRFPNDPNARAALGAACTLHAYLEEWPQLAESSTALLARRDLDDVDRLTALGGRGLAEVETGEIDHGARDIEDGLDIVERIHYGALNRLPVPAAMIRYALGELRRVRSERISLSPPGPDFLAKMDARCGLLLGAQNAYADAIRAVDPHWAAMSGYRVGEMYRRLHEELMRIPPVQDAKTERQKQLHFGMMHLRYRVLLEKGTDMMDRTLALAEKTGDDSAWVRRAEDAKRAMGQALDEEKAQIAKLPFTEEELEKALEILKKKVTKSPAADAP
ncbi:MAG TPA: tetratricopeptide repeat protein [Polyangiaceae bacterium]